MFLGHHGSKLYETLHGHNLAWNLHFHCRFDDLDFVSRSHLCQKCKVQMVYY